jgi:hypothetical protein
MSNEQQPEFRVIAGRSVGRGNRGAFRFDLRSCRFGSLTVVEPTWVNGRGFWRCKCDCGQERVVTTSVLRLGLLDNCGCLAKERRRKNAATANLTHGASRSREYSTWSGMWQRCRNPKSVAFAKYGGRGISVCDRWRLFENFLADMGRRPAGTSLDRIDVNGNYEPGNCRWATPEEQNKNQRTSLERTANLFGAAIDFARNHPGRTYSAKEVERILTGLRDAICGRDK